MTVNIFDAIVARRALFNISKIFIALWLAAFNNNGLRHRTMKIKQLSAASPADTATDVTARYDGARYGPEDKITLSFATP